MEWKQAKEGSLAKWRQIQAEVGQVSLRDLLERVTEACAFCDIAEEKQTLAKQQGLPRARVKCQFCEVYQLYGGCRDHIDALIGAALDEDWDRVRDQVDALIHWIEEMEIPVAPPATHELVPTGAVS